MSTIPFEQRNPNDASIKRNRAGRWVVLILYTLLVLSVCVGGATKIGGDWFGSYGSLIGLFVGLGLAVCALSVTLGKFFIRVDLVSALVTIDLLHTIGGERSVPPTAASSTESDEARARNRQAFPSYGPGLHVAYPWERRDEEYNISLKEVSADIKFPILLSDGLVTVEGSYRIRADIKNLIPFLGGVASAPEELEDLISAHAFNLLQGKSVDEAQGYAGTLSDELKGKFGLITSDGSPHGTSDGVADFERRFGIFVGDVTISRILPSAEVQRTRSSVQEAKAIALGTATMLGYPSVQAMRLAESKGKLSADQIARARDRFMAASGNLEGMNVTRWEGDLNIAGLDPEAVKEIARAMKPLAEAFGTSKKGKK